MPASAQPEQIKVREEQAEAEGKPAIMPVPAEKSQSHAKREKVPATKEQTTVIIQAPRAPCLKYARAYNAGTYETETFALDYPLKGYGDSEGIGEFLALVDELKNGARSIRDVPARIPDRPSADAGAGGAPASAERRVAVPAREVYPRQRSDEASSAQRQLIHDLAARLGIQEPGPLTRKEAHEWIEANKDWPDKPQQGGRWRR